MQEILSLQYIAYQSEAALYGTQDISLLKQTLEELIQEYNCDAVFKIKDNDKIIGSVSVKSDNGTVYIGKLMVQPSYQKRCFGKRLLNKEKISLPLIKK